MLLKCRFMIVLTFLNPLTLPLNLLLSQEASAVQHPVQEWLGSWIPDKDDFRPVLPNEEKIWRVTASEFFEDASHLALCDAITRHDREKLIKLLAEDFDVRALGKHDMTFLYWAYIHGNLPAFKTLLERGASPDIRLKTELTLVRNVNLLVEPMRTTGSSVLLHAFQNSFHRPGFFALGLRHTKEPNQGLRNGATFAHHIAGGIMALENLQLLSAVIHAGVDVDAKNNDGMTACHVAADHNPDALLLLVIAGADTSIPFPDGTSLTDTVRANCNPVDNALLHYHYRTVLHWMNLQDTPPRFESVGQE